MTWTPPPESERPHGYRCLVLIEAYWGATASGDAFGRAIWITCEWDTDEKLWVTPLKGVSIDNILKFAPSPRVSSARIAELETENARLRILLDALDAYARGEPSQPPMTGIEKRTALLCQFDDAMRNLSQGMEPLGPDFERVWDENLDALLSDDPLPGKDTR
jgi:hypothetical protein